MGGLRYALLSIEYAEREEEREGVCLRCIWGSSLILLSPKWILESLSVGLVMVSNRVLRTLYPL